MAFTPRNCFIKKCAGFKRFGFTLHAVVENEKVRGYINKIDAGSPADKSGLLVGDRLVEVNGVNIEKDSYQQIIERINASGDEVRLLVVDQETDDYYTGLGMAITCAAAEDQQPLPDLNKSATTYSDVINETATTDVSKTNTVQQTVRPVSAKKLLHSSRHTQAPISNSISGATQQQLLPSSSQYRTYGSNIVSRSSRYTLGTLPPTTNDAAAWFACLCCFWPAALVAIVKNSDVRDCAARGDMTGAYIAAESARRWTSISICVGVVIFVITGVCIGVLKSLPAQNT